MSHLAVPIFPPSYRGLSFGVEISPSWTFFLAQSTLCTWLEFCTNMISFLVEARIQRSLEDITKENVEWICSKSIYAFLKVPIRCLFGVRSLHSLGLSFCYLQISRLGLGLGDCIVLKFRLITSLGLVRSIYSWMRCRTAPLTLSLNLKTSLHQVAAVLSYNFFLEKD